MYIPVFGAALAMSLCAIPPAISRPNVDTHEKTLAGLAGEYFFSDGFESETLRISNRRRFTLAYTNCTGGYRIRGDATLVEGHVVLGTGFAYRFLPARRLIDLIPIRWGDRLYLVPKDAGESFCTHVNLRGSSGYPGGTFYIRSGDEKKQVDGLPSVPEEWETMLLATPLVGRIVEVMKPGRARVNLGYKNGIWNGMVLWATCEGSPWVETVDVHATSCVIESNHPATIFKVGDLVSSRQTRRPAGRTLKLDAN
jgi:hypothetical protein